VLIHGETGTGKEMCARAIHYLSPQSSRPFVPVNCGAIPTDLVENELFGHQGGAFTGARASQPGLIDEANEGTLFLDEVDCLPMLAQVKLLRFLQDGEYRPLGSTKVRRAAIRVISATNTDLEQAVSENKLRRDLYYRLNIVEIKLPPLRDRAEDIPVLARHFLSKYAREFNKQVVEFAPDALRRLASHDWPGNVRELEHVVQRATVLSEERIIKASDLMLASEQPGSEAESLREAKARVVGHFERNYIKGLLLAYKGNITRAAEAAGKNRRAFWELIRKHRIDVESLRLNRMEAKQ
jgi:DNA-binding NtrC family response regulator